MRIQTHPDRLKKEHMSAEEKAKIDETAANVGFAAEVLSDPELVSSALKKISKAIDSDLIKSVRDTTAL